MNKQTTLFTAILAVGSLLLLAGCVKYKTLPLQQPQTTTTKKGLSLEHKVFNEQDCQTYLGRKKLLKKGFQPVQITIINNTDNIYTCDPSSLSLSTATTQQVIEKVRFSTARRIFGYGSAAIVCLATTAGIICCIPSSAPLWIGLTLCASTIGTLGFPTAAILNGTKSHKANKQLRADFDEKALPNEGNIRPGQSITGIVFVPTNEFKKDFTFTVYDAQTNLPVILSSETNNNIK